MTPGGMRSQALPVASPQTEDGNQGGGASCSRRQTRLGAVAPWSLASAIQEFSHPSSAPSSPTARPPPHPPMLSPCPSGSSSTKPGSSSDLGTTPARRLWAARRTLCLKGRRGARPSGPALQTSGHKEEVQWVCRGQGRRAGSNNEASPPPFRAPRGCRWTPGRAGGPIFPLNSGPLPTFRGCFSSPGASSSVTGDPQDWGL